MAERKSATKNAKKSATSTAVTGKASKGFTDFERAAMRERVQEMKAAAEGAEGEVAVLAKIAALPTHDRTLAERLHAIIKASAPILSPKTWYGMPAYARDDKVVVFFRPAVKFKERYMTLGFNPEARLDEGHMWPIAYAITDLTAADEARIAALVKKAVS
jgi:uncharacterized protein YdhG (YjbR/CyaY superfamily)